MLKSVQAPKQRTDQYRPADLIGLGGKAWILRQHESQRRPDHDGSLVTYLLHCPGAHPFWSWWMVSMIHLRDLPGLPPATKHFPEATHEFLIVAVNPEHQGQPDLKAFETGAQESFPLLRPVDVCQQLGDLTDERALGIATSAIRAILDGHMSPDQDYRQAWKQVLQGTADHMRTGAHDPN